MLSVLALMWWWSYEPGQFDVVALAQKRATSHQQQPVTGSVVTSTLMGCAETLLDKRGGYFSNDKFPPGLFMDNVPNWEFGVLTATRDLSRELRNKFSRSQSQSEEDVDLKEADPLFSSPNDRWLLPSSEGQYAKAIEHVDGYFTRIGKNDTNNAQFYPRADNLADYLDLVSTRLGGRVSSNWLGMPPPACERHRRRLAPISCATRSRFRKTERRVRWPGRMTERPGQ